MKSKTIEMVREQVRQKTPELIIEFIAGQVDIAALASKRVADEGIVVRDMKGSIMPHPAIKIDSDANKIICDLLIKHRK